MVSEHVKYVLSTTDSTSDVKSDDFGPQEIVTWSDVRGDRDSVVATVVLYASSRLE